MNAVPDDRVVHDLGLPTDGLADLPLPDALDVAAGLGLSTVESRGLRLEAFNAGGNPLHPAHGADHARVVGSALRLAEEFGVRTLVLMSGLPAAPGDSFPAWVTTVWPPEDLRLLEHQWDVAREHRLPPAAEAERRGVRLAVEMHADQLVPNVPTLLRLRESAGESVGADLDPSHLFWVGADPPAAAHALTGVIHHVHAEDTAVAASTAAVTSLLHPVDNAAVGERVWNHVAVGAGHDAGWWRGFLAARTPTAATTVPHPDPTGGTP